MNSFILYAFLVLSLCSAGTSMGLDRCLVPMLKADLSFTLLDFGNSDREYRIDFKQPHNALIKGYGKWTFSVIQNSVLHGNKGFVVYSKCVEGCPDDRFDLPAAGSVIVRTHTKLLVNWTAVLNNIKTWNQLKRDRGWGLHTSYGSLNSGAYGQKVTVSFTLNVPRPIEQCINIDAENAGAEFAKMCFRSVNSNEEMAVLQFRDGNISAYPSVLREHSAVLSELLDISRENEEPLMIDLRAFTRDIGKMFFEILCSGVVKETVNENRAQHISNLMKLYELGHKFQMDNIMLGAIDGFQHLYAKPTGSESYDFMDLLSRLKSQVGDDFRDRVLEVRFNSEQLHQRQQRRPSSRLKKLINKYF
ncbi:hypothetical protein MP638_006336 [Amoeboaphelidium occidentale]|nr:hypothetical protein MP638_006336 [Amoeboaphelidium occidentale]